MLFYLGIHRPHWMPRLDVPIFVSRVTLSRYRKLPRAAGRWALDSGAFSEISAHGRWTVTAREYAAEVERYAAEVGGLDWAAPMDWMCEPHILSKTGLSVIDHQRRTLQSVIDLRGLVSAVPVIPVLQGYELHDYHRHADAYELAGIDLSAEPVVGIGSVCRRQSMGEAVHIIRSLAARGIRLHGFGVKTTGLAAFADSLTSADSMAWSFQARRMRNTGELPGPGSCANCMKYALHWRDKCLKTIEKTESRRTLTPVAFQATFDFSPAT